MATGDPFLEHSGVVHIVSFSPDGKNLVSSFSHEVFTLDVESRKRKYPPLKVHSSPSFPVAFSHGNEKMVSGSWDDKIHIWDISSRQAV